MSAGPKKLSHLHPRRASEMLPNRGRKLGRRRQIGRKSCSMKERVNRMCPYRTSSGSKCVRTASLRCCRQDPVEINTAVILKKDHSM